MRDSVPCTYNTGRGRPAEADSVLSSVADVSRNVQKMHQTTTATQRKRVEMVYTAAQNTDRRKLSQVKETMIGRRSPLPESQGGPRILARGNLVDKFMQ